MTRVALITGGSTPERNVALAGARQVVAALRRGGFEVVVVDTCSGALQGSAEAELLEQGAGQAPLSAQECRELARREDLFAVAALDAVRGADVVFPLLHGSSGEGGAFQTVMELAGRRLVGSDSRGSLLAMDKEVTKRLLAFAGIPTAAWVRWPAASHEVEQLGFPLVVKPSRVGSSVGAAVVHSADDLEAAVERALRFDDELLLEEFLAGREFTVGVLGDEALGVGEIGFEGELFDFVAKYTPGAASEVFPAPVELSVAEELRALALATHRCLRLRDFSRVDLRLDAAGRALVLEANTLPGMTATSLLPQSAAAVGIGMDALCARMVELALAR